MVLLEETVLSSHAPVWVNAYLNLKISFFFIFNSNFYIFKLNVETKKSITPNCENVFRLYG